MIASGWSRISQIGAPIPKGGRQHCMKIKKIGPRVAQGTAIDCCPQVIKYATNERSTLGSIRGSPSCIWPKWSCLYARSTTPKGLKWTKLSMEVGGLPFMFRPMQRMCSMCNISEFRKVYERHSVSAFCKQYSRTKNQIGPLYTNSKKLNESYVHAWDSDFSVSLCVIVMCETSIPTGKK